MTSYHLKQKLQSLITFFVLKTHSLEYSIVHGYFIDLKIRFAGEQFIHDFTNHLQNLLPDNRNSVADFISNICIINLNNEELIQDLIGFFDTTINNELEERIRIIEQRLDEQV